MHKATDASADNCILVFIRAPQLGRVKTRLTRFLQPEVVLELYKCFVEDILATLAALQVPVLLVYHPAAARQAIVDWLGPGHTLIPQRGADLGWRMIHAFRDAFERDFRRVVLIGSDFPDLPPPVLSEALQGLERYPAVIGPTFDGGYYLIGFDAEHFLQPVFEQIPWSTNRVFDRTMRIFEQHRYRVYRVEKWRDIDEHDDLLELMQHAPAASQTASRTFAFLKAHGLKPNDRP